MRIVFKLAAIVLLGAGVVSACGDKLLIFGRGMRPTAPAAILGYMPVGSPVSALFNDPAFRRSLQKAGHKIVFAEDPQALAEAWQSKKYDFVLADVRELAKLEETLAAFPAGPVILPVVYEGTRAEERAAKSRYRTVLLAPGKVGAYLSAIDLVLEIKNRQNRKAAIKG